MMFCFSGCQLIVSKKKNNIYSFMKKQFHCNLTSAH